MKRTTTFLSYSFLILASLVVLVPVTWLILASFKTKAQMAVWPPLFLFKPTFVAYKEILGGNFPGYFLNSLIISTGSVLLSLAIGIPAAYGITRFKFMGRESFKFWILSTRMAPAFGFIVPYFLIFRNARLLDTYTALIIIYSVFNLSFITWMLIGFIQEIPREIEEAAMIDGCSRWGILLRVVLPLMAPGLSATVILSFIFSWNEFLYAFVLTAAKTKTAPVAITNYIGFYGIEWDRMCASSTICILPILLLALIVQKYLVRGLTLGAVKG